MAGKPTTCPLSPSTSLNTIPTAAKGVGLRSTAPASARRLSPAFSGWQPTRRSKTAAERSGCRHRIIGISMRSAANATVRQVAGARQKGSALFRNALERFTDHRGWGTPHGAGAALGVAPLRTSKRPRVSEAVYCESFGVGCEVIVGKLAHEELGRQRRVDLYELSRRLREIKSVGR